MAVAYYKGKIRYRQACERCFGQKQYCIACGSTGSVGKYHASPEAFEKYWARLEERYIERKLKAQE